MKALIFGTGVFYQNRKHLFKDLEIVAFLDNDKQKQEIIFEGKRIIGPEQLFQEEYDVIYLMSGCQQEMRNQLLELGVARETIADYRDLKSQKKYKRIMIYGDVRNWYHSSAKRILLISTTTNGLSLVGGSIALLNMAIVLKSCGYLPVIASPKDGPLRAEATKHDINIIIDFSLNFGVLEEKKWYSRFNIIIVNSLESCYLLRKCNRNVPIIWWLHEMWVSQLWNELTSNIINAVSNNGNIFVYGVSAMVLQSYGKYFFDKKNITLLRYGLPDFYSNMSKVKNDKMVFAIVGRISYPKGIDVFINAIKLLEDEEMKCAEFWIIGNDQVDLEFTKKLKNISENILEIKWVGPLNRSQMERIYSEISVIVCSSRGDSAPIVVAEGMMNYKIPLISSMTGIKEVILDKKNGLIFESENIEELADKMRWLIKNRMFLSNMGIKARETYEQYFSMETFKNIVLQVVEDIENI